MRERLQQGKIDGQLRAGVLKEVERLFLAKACSYAVRPDSEDLPNFSGAGLYPRAERTRAGADTRGDQNRLARSEFRSLRSTR